MKSLFHWTSKKARAFIPNFHLCGFCAVINSIGSALWSEGKKGNPQADVKTVRCNTNLELLTLGTSADITEPE